MTLAKAPRVLQGGSTPLAAAPAHRPALTPAVRAGIPPLPKEEALAHLTSRVRGPVQGWGHLLGSCLSGASEPMLLEPLRFPFLPEAPRFGDLSEVCLPQHPSTQHPAPSPVLAGPCRACRVGRWRRSMVAEPPRGAGCLHSLRWAAAAQRFRRARRRAGPGRLVVISCERERWRPRRTEPRGPHWRWAHRCFRVLFERLGLAPGWGERRGPWPSQAGGVREEGASLAEALPACLTPGLLLARLPATRPSPRSQLRSGARFPCHELGKSRHPFLHPVFSAVRVVSGDDCNPRNGHRYVGSGPHRSLSPHSPSLTVPPWRSPPRGSHVVAARHSQPPVTPPSLPGGERRKVST